MKNISIYLKQAFGPIGLTLPVLTSLTVVEKFISFGFIIIVLILMHQLKVERIKRVAEAAAGLHKKGKLKSFSFEKEKIDVQFFEEKTSQKKVRRKRTPSP